MALAAGTRLGVFEILARLGYAADHRRIALGLHPIKPGRDEEKLN